MCIDKLKTRFSQSIAGKNIATLAAGTVIGQGIMISATLVLSRLFAPSEFGVLAVFMAVTAVVATFVTLRYEVHIVVPKDDVDAEVLVHLSITLAVCIGFLVFIVVLFLPAKLQTYFGIGALKSWLPWACLTGIVTAVSATSFGWLNRCQLYKLITKLRILQSFIFSIAAILLGLLGLYDGLILSQIISVFIVMLVASRYLRMPAGADYRALSAVAKKYISAPRYMLPTAILDVVTQQIPVIVIGAWYGAADAGKFSLAWRVLILPASLIGAAVGQVFFQRFSTVWPDAGAAWSLLIRAWKYLAIIGILPMTAIVLGGEELFDLIFGSSWADSGKMAAILAPMLFVSLLHSPTSTTSIVLGLQKYILLLSISVLIYRPLSLYIGWKVDNIYMGLSIYCTLEILQILIFQFIIYKAIKNKANSQGIIK